MLAGVPNAWFACDNQSSPEYADACVPKLVVIRKMSTRVVRFIETSNTFSALSYRMNCRYFYHGISIVGIPENKQGTVWMLIDVRVCVLGVIGALQSWY